VTPLFWLALVLFVVVDVVVILVIMRRFSASMLGLMLPGGDRNKLFESVHAMVGDYLRANYSGDPRQLPGALGGLVPKLRDMLRSNGVEPRPEVVRALIEVSAAKHRIASARELREALATVG
jgi:hypothetical protein